MPRVAALVPSRRLTVFLLRGIGTPDDALSTEHTPRKVDLDPGSGLDGRFYYTSRPASPPNWVGFIRPVVTEALNINSSSASGLLVLKAGAEYFGITFGYGRSLLNPIAIERQFGLRVALNRIDPDQIRSIDAKTFEDMVVSKNVQTSRSTDLPAFGVDVTRDIVRAVVGEPKDATFAKRVAGSDALVVNLAIEAKDLPAKLLEFHAAFKDTAYKSNFDWIDHLALVHDPLLVDALDRLLVDDLKAGNTSTTHLAMPEPLAWEDIDSFKIAGARNVEYDELDLDAYVSDLGSDRAKITIDVLKSRRVRVKFGRNSDYDSMWTLYGCLVSEQSLAGELYVLIEGRWFAVSKGLVNQVDAFVGSIPPGRAVLPDARPGEKEGDYNLRAATLTPTELLNLDTKILRAAGANSGIEACDLLSASGVFIHVKRKSRSSTLSHLFAQGAVSAATLISDDVFRRNLRAAIIAAAGPADPSPWLAFVPAGGNVARSNITVSYVVIANSSKSGVDWLPFFSRLNLMQQGKQLLNLGVHVSLDRVSTT